MKNVVKWVFRMNKCRKSDFRSYVAKKVAQSGGIRITKDAGVFLCKNPHTKGMAV